MTLKPSKTGNFNSNNPLKSWYFPKTYLETAVALQSSVPICNFMGTSLSLVNISNNELEERGFFLILFRTSERFGIFHCVYEGKFTVEQTHNF